MLCHEAIELRKLNCGISTLMDKFSGSMTGTGKMQFILDRLEKQRRFFK